METTTGATEKVCIAVDAPQASIPVTLIVPALAAGFTKIMFSKFVTDQPAGVAQVQETIFGLGLTK